jgi:hypothetical protein
MVWRVAAPLQFISSMARCNVNLLQLLFVAVTIQKQNHAHSFAAPHGDNKSNNNNYNNNTQISSK